MPVKHHKRTGWAGAAAAAVFIFGFAILSCDVRVPGRRVHPNDQSTLHASEAVRAEVVEVDDDKLAKGLAVRGGKDWAGIIGSRDEDSQVIGRIERAALTSSGTVAVLDSYAKQLLHFNSNGQLIQRLSRPGRGPGELFAPRALGHAQDELVVFDGNGRMLIYRIKSEQLILKTEVDLQLEVYDACLSKNVMLVHGRRPGDLRIFHLFTRAGEYIRSFGQVYRSGNPIIDHQLSRGLVGCGHGRFVFAGTALLELRVYDESGRELWWLPTGETNAVEFVDGGEGSFMRFPELGFELTVSLVVHPIENQALWQLERVAAGGRPGASENEIETIAVDLDHPGGFRVGGLHPLRQVYSWRGNGLLVRHNSDFPRLGIIAADPALALRRADSGSRP